MMTILQLDKSVTPTNSISSERVLKAGTINVINNRINFMLL